MGKLIDEGLLQEKLALIPMEERTFRRTVEELENASPVEAIPKEYYETRLKADMVAMLKDLAKKIEGQCKIPNNHASAYDWNNGVYACYEVIQQKIDKLKGE